MKTSIQLLAVAALVTGFSVEAQNASGFKADFRTSLLMAPADTGGSAGTSAEDEKAQQAELAKQTLNPVASLISVPIQNNWDFGIGPADAMKYTANIQPVVPITLNKDLNLIVRTILPVIYAEAPAAGLKDHTGLGDITQSFFFSPKEPVGGWILGAGPVMYYPAATDPALGAGKWGAGPTFVALQQAHGWTYGMLANQIWSYAGWSHNTINASFVQPFASFTTKTFTSFTVNSEATYNWQVGEATVPLNFMVSQLLKVGKQPISLQLGYRYYAQRPLDVPDWGLRFAVTFLFPKKH